ncbi:MAG: hypothetical protein O2820_00280 [Planctomycetota bacterium]|nr:hypothetical protein [Planctomycetota bacterium]MDA1247631.1 hypothetical protein [Planctomycetota bacterium]
MPVSHPPAANSASLKRSFVWMFAGNLIFTATQWGMLAVLTKLTSDAVSGQYGMGLSLSTPVFMFAGLDLRLLLVTDSEQRYRFSDCLTLRLLCGGLALVAVLATGLAWGYDGATLAVIMAVAFGKLVELISDTYYGFIQTHRRLDAVSVSMVLHGVISSAGFIGCLYFTGSVFAASVAYSLGRVAALLLYDLPLTARLRSAAATNDADDDSASFARLYSLAKAGAPLSVKTLLVSLNTHVARYFVAAKFGLAGLGVFFPIAQLGFAGLIFSRALNQAVAGRVGELAQSRRMVEFRRLLLRLLGVYAVLGAGCVGIAALAGPSLLTIAFDEGYAQHSLILTLVMVAMAVQFMTGILDLAMIALRRTMLPAWLSAGSLGILTLACWQWVPEFGFAGAASAMIVSRLPRPFILAWFVFRADGPVCEISKSHSVPQVDSPQQIPAREAA